MQRPTILVVEDNPVEQKIVELLARRCDVTAEIVGTAYKALELLAHKGDYSAVLLNYMLPAMNGLECAHRIREFHTGVRQIPIIAVTAVAGEEARIECFEAGMDDYLSKPYSLEDFAAMLDRWVRKPVVAGR